MVQKEEIGLSICHRESTRLQLGDAVHLRVLMLPQPKPVVGLMQLEVSTYVRPSKKDPLWCFSCCAVAFPSCVFVGAGAVNLLCLFPSCSGVGCGALGLFLSFPVVFPPPVSPFCRFSLRISVSDSVRSWIVSFCRPLAPCLFIAVFAIVAWSSLFLLAMLLCVQRGLFLCCLLIAFSVSFECLILFWFMMLLRVVSSMLVLPSLAISTEGSGGFSQYIVCCVRTLFRFVCPAHAQWIGFILPCFLLSCLFCLFDCLFPKRFLVQFHLGAGMRLFGCLCMLISFLLIFPCFVVFPLWFCFSGTHLY